MTRSKQVEASARNVAAVERYIAAKLCRLGIHHWHYFDPTWRKCARCGRHESFKFVPPGWSEWPGGQRAEDEWRDRQEYSEEQEEKRAAQRGAL